MQFITQGIGTPSDIPHFILVGLSPTGVIAPARRAQDASLWTMPLRATVYGRETRRSDRQVEQRRTIQEAP